MWNALLLTFIAGISTLIGGVVIFFIKEPKEIYLNLAMGFSAGVMIFIAFTELLQESILGIGYGTAIIAFFAGMIVIYLIDLLIPHTYEGETVCKRNNLKRCGTLIAIGIAIHNFPEGIAVFYSALADMKLGIALALAVALHNIPEGIAVATPIYYATKSKSKAFLYTLLAGLAEPLGAIVSYFFLYRFIDDYMLNIILGAVAGIMVFISFDELLPRAYKEENINTIIAGILAGMAIMALSLYLLWK